MRLSIIPEDKTVCVNGVCKQPLNLKSCDIPLDIHAFQWYETWGDIEYKTLPDGTKPMNLRVLIVPEWASKSYDVFEKTPAVHPIG